MDETTSFPIKAREIDHFNASLLLGIWIWFLLVFPSLLGIGVPSVMI